MALTSKTEGNTVSNNGRTEAFYQSITPVMDGVFPSVETNTFAAWKSGWVMEGRHNLAGGKMTGESDIQFLRSER